MWDHISHASVWWKYLDQQFTHSLVRSSACSLVDAVVISFIWGTLGFHEHIKSVVVAILALALLLFGIGGLCVCNAHIPVHLPPALSFLYILPFLQDPAAEEELLEFTTPSKFKYSESQYLLHKIVPKDDHRGELTSVNWVIGLGCSVIVGYDQCRSQSHSTTTSAKHIDGWQQQHVDFSTARSWFRRIFYRRYACQLLVLRNDRSIDLTNALALGHY